jgi:cytochrome c biogenesis protein CcmG/thiol:disulfide interchange protein DsbE
MGKQESMTSGERSDVRRSRPPGGTEPDAPPGQATGPSATPQPGQATGPSEADRPPRGWAARMATMSRRRRLALTAATAVLAVFVAIVAIGGTSSGPAKPDSDPVAPAFTLALLGHRGGHISLAGLAGRPVIVNFFASWCEPCQKETPLLARFYRAAHGSITLIGIDANDKASAALRFTHAAGVTYPVGFDPYPMPTTISYGVSGLPQTFFLDSRHRIVKRIFGAVTEQELRSGVALITAPAKRG